MSAQLKPKFREIEDTACAIQCWQNARNALVSPQYGLEHSRFLPEEYRRIVAHKYYILSRDAHEVAILRMIPNLSMKRYLRNLNERVQVLIKKHFRFCDLGLYYLTHVNRPERVRTVTDVVEFSALVAKDAGLNALYIQIPLAQQKFCSGLGFQNAGKPFVAAGWQKSYVPMFRMI